MVDLAPDLVVDHTLGAVAHFNADASIDLTLDRGIEARHEALVHPRSGLDGQKVEPATRQTEIVVLRALPGVVIAYAVCSRRFADASRCAMWPCQGTWPLWCRIASGSLAAHDAHRNRLAIADIPFIAGAVGHDRHQDVPACTEETNFSTIAHSISLKWSDTAAFIKMINDALSDPVIIFNQNDPAHIAIGFNSPDCLRRTRCRQSGHRHEQ